MNDIEAKAIEFIKFYKEYCLKQEQENMKNGNYETVNDEQFVYKNLEIVLKLIENLLNRIKDLEEINEAHKKENGELRERVKDLEEENAEIKQEWCCMTTCLRKDKEKLFLENKIKEKIEELDYKGEHYIFNEKDNAVRLGKIQVLEELLKGE